MKSFFFHLTQFDFSFVDTYRVRQFEFNPIVEPHKRKGYFYEKQVDFDFFEQFDQEDNEAKVNKVSVGVSESSKKRRPALSSSVWNCDGEILNEAAIHVKLHCQIVNIFATGCDVEQLLGTRPTKVRFQ